MVRNRAMLYMLWDTPGRKNELRTLTVEAVDMDAVAILVPKKGRRERWMPLGSVAMESLWEYMQLRGTIAKSTNALWDDWLRWAQHWWTEDLDSEAVRLGKDSVRELYRLAANVKAKAADTEDLEERVRLVTLSESISDWGRKCESRNRRNLAPNFCG